LAAVNFTPDLLAHVPREVCLRFDVLPVFYCEGYLLVACSEQAMGDFDNLDAIRQAVTAENLEFRTADSWLLAFYLHKFHGGEPPPPTPAP
jgi:hypothetical protein